MNEVYLLIGGNMGERVMYLSGAARAIASASGGGITKQSSLYETEAWGKEDQEAFLNQVLCISTVLSPEDLLSTILGIEEAMGRKRDVRYGPRIIDIDILFYNDMVIDLPGLKIPHPQMQNRRFVLVPLREIAPGKIHPVLHKNITRLLEECNDPLMVNKIS